MLTLSPAARVYVVTGTTDLRRSIDGALLYSLAQGCKLAGVSPFAYFKDVLRRLPTHPHRLIDQLTPQGWATAFGAGG